MFAQLQQHRGSHGNCVGSFMIAAPPIITDRLFLRPVELGDAPEIAALMSPQISQTLTSWPPAMTVAVALRHIRKSRVAMAAGRGVGWGIFLKHDLHLIGWVGVTMGRTEGSPPEICCWIGEIFQRQLFAAEAMASIIAQASKIQGADGLVAHVLPDNVAGVALLKKLGFTESLHPQKPASANDNKNVSSRFQCNLQSLPSPEPGILNPYSFVSV